ncbi:glycerophosphodiester phosphodiesterase [Bacillus taeanensis]|uniref:Glycerophosphodiester phosphodiesterase n=1 Tax=Bacillus taeanensis TaxID=273032 RepID=A0A366XXL2_9BACI|nr:glycerophosphodiester phosphodiesterase [Bacillus taeanensis]RBW70637.1 glycerophosphodiester phosphodiesterase [Bacillus taeanensis]
MTLIFAHRGASRRCPENTMIAFKTAHKLGAHGIELDVQLSKDGIPVVIHDHYLKRTTNGTGYIKDKTFSELKKLDAGSWFSKTYKNETIPSLEELCEWSNSTDLLLNIELKNQDITYEGLEEKVITLIHRYQLEKRVILSSFNHNSLLTVNNIDAHIKTAPIYKANLYEPWNYAKNLKAKGAHPHYKTLTKEKIANFHKHRISVRPYTVNNEKVMRTFIQWKVDALITDLPSLGLSVLKEVKDNIQPVKKHPLWKKLFKR